LRPNLGASKKYTVKKWLSGDHATGELSRRRLIPCGSALRFTRSNVAIFASMEIVAPLANLGQFVVANTNPPIIWAKIELTNAILTSKHYRWKRKGLEKRQVAKI
jgi:hypothetical protein